MPRIERHWEKLSEEKWEHLAVEWLQCIKAKKGDDDEPCNKWWQIIINLGLWGPPDCLWEFTKLVVSLADDDQLEYIAAGPIEYLLGRAGPEYISVVEVEVENNPKLLRAIKHCNQYRMTDEVWTRIQRLQARA